MKNINYLTLILISLLVVGCSKITDPLKKVGLGSRVVNYQADDKVDSLVIPPDLTKPSFQGEFSEVTEVSNNENIIKKVQNVEVMRDKYRRWLIVDLPPSEVWNLSKEFFRSYNFKIEKENQKIGILETDYLEIDTKVPDKSLGVIRANIAKVLKTKYGLPIADKYRIRIEPIEGQNKSEVYLTLSSIGEVVSGAVRVWQPRDKDVELETEMLLKLMVFLGSDRMEAISNIEANIASDGPSSSVVTSESGYAVLVLPYDKKQSWSYLGWSLDELGIDVQDRDSLEGSFLIKVNPNKGFFSKILGSMDKDTTYQLIIKEVGESQSTVIFVDLSEENEQDIIDYSIELFNQIALKF
ncbi:outer membrane protein assembly factor BamC [Candidatus Pseudothioglobus sp. Uisw_016]|uniref:outer membrane protein assembly factor BamC n=1 Tax=Candidatus Pseudothioglobus sp. Uisw_016 TaxID=3230995 RepID=UPI003A8C52EB